MCVSMCVCVCVCVCVFNICRRRTATYIPEGDNSLFLCSKLKFTK